MADDNKGKCRWKSSEVLAICLEVLRIARIILDGLLWVLRITAPLVVIALVSWYVLLMPSPLRYSSFDLRFGIGALLLGGAGFVLWRRFRRR